MYPFTVKCILTAYSNQQQTKYMNIGQQSEILNLPCTEAAEFNKYNEQGDAHSK